MNYLIFILTFLFFQQDNQNLYGSYSSVKSGFEWYSILTLEEGNRFKYTYGIGGCRSEIEGSFRISEGKRLIFIYDEEYQKMKFGSDINKKDISSDLDLEETTTPCLPDLNRGNWTIKRNRLKLNNEMNCSCWPVQGIHKRIKSKK